MALIPEDYGRPRPCCLGCRHAIGQHARAPSAPDDLTDHNDDMRQLDRRAVLRTLAATAAIAGGVRHGAASSPAFPSRTIRFVVPYAAGGGPDVLTRQFTPRLSKALGQTVVVDNRVGAGGLIAAEYVAQQAPDGHTWLLGSSTHLTQKLLQPKSSFDPIKSFAHVLRLSTAPSLLVVRAGAPYRSLADLLAAARSAPGRLNYGSGGIGSAAHLTAATLVHQAGVECTHIPYRGSVELGAALAAGDIQFAIPTASTVAPLLQTGQLRALAISSSQRERLWPELPTLRELMGSDDLALVAWTGLWLPAGTPAPILGRLYAVHRQLYADPEVVRAHANLGVSVAPSPTEGEFAEFVAAEYAKLERVVKNARVVLS